MNSEIKNIRNAILNEFRNDYPASAQFRGGRPLRKGRWEQLFPGIETDPHIKDEFLSAAEELQEQGVLSIKWVRHRRGDRIEALYLRDPSRLYHIVGQPSPEQQREKSLTLLAEYQKHLSCRGAGRDNRFVEDLIEHIQARIEAFIPTPCSDPENLSDLLKLMDADRRMIDELPLRALSVRLYNDSKRLESLLPQADRLAMAVAGEKLTDRYGLARTYPQSALRGDVELVLEDGQVWNLDGEPFYLGPELIERLALLSVVKALLVVENKETFMTLPHEKCGFSALMYGGGHLNPVAVKLLQLIEQSGIELYYFGDLDPDGLLIFQHAEDKLSGKLIPWHMDADTYQRYLRYGYRLSEGSLSRLSYLHPEHFTGLWELIRQHGLGIEQEVIDPLNPE